MKVRAKKNNKFKVEKLKEDKKAKNKLKVGDIVLYSTKVHMEKCEISSVEGKIAVLSNKVKVFRRYDKVIIRADGNPASQIRLWDDQTAKEWDFYCIKPELVSGLELAKNKINKIIPRDVDITTLNKLMKQLNKFNSI